jgi:predicted permease
MRLEHWLYTLPLRLRSLFRGRQMDRELDDEMQYHLEQLMQEHVARGLSSEEARYAALRAMDGLTQNKEKSRETRKVSSITNFARDARYALRLLRKSPGFSAIAILTLALGIGANSAIFSVVNAVLLRPLPFPQPDRLVRLWEASPNRNWHRNVINPWNFLDWRDNTHAFEDMAAISGFQFNLTGDGEPVAVPGLQVSPGFFSILRIPAYLGRTFAADDGIPGHDDKVILSHGLWQTRFGGDPGIVGKTLNVNGAPHVVIGVMPPGFSFPKNPAQLWTPFALTRSKEFSEGRYLSAVARLKPGVTLDGAQRDIEAAARVTVTLRPDYNKKWSAEAVPLLEDVTKDLRRPLWVLLAAVGLLLLIACANVANLLLMRGSGRLREIAVRETLGATRRRIVQQLLIESLVLAMAGLAAGLAFAKLGLRGLLAIIPQSAPLPRSEPITIDGQVFAFTLVASILTAVLFGLAPSLRLSRVRLHDTLKQGSQRGSGGHRRLRQALVMAEIALAILLAVGAGLMLRSFQRLLAVDPGFDTQHVVTMRLFTSPAKYRDVHKRSRYMQRILSEVRGVPGVEAAGTVHFLPLEGSESASCFAPGNQEPKPASSPDARFLIISPGYLSAMGTRILSGRDFDDRDQVGSPSVMLVNQAFVRSFLPGQNPIGQRFSVCWDVPNPAEIVGVVNDTRQTGLEDTPQPRIFLSNSQAPMFFASVVVRANGDPRQILSSVEAAIHRADPEQAVSDMRTMDDVLSDSVSRPRFQALLLLVFAALALGLATIGVYGVISYSVSQRTREIGIRVALGAGHGDVMYLVMKEAVFLVGLGLAIGLIGALALTRVLRSLLFEVTPTDPLTLLSVSSAAVAAAALATYLPARRAVKVDPMLGLRCE